MLAYAPHTLVIHHSAGLAGGEDIRRIHMSQKGGYDEIAYNAVIERDGTIFWGRPLGTKPAANAGQNAGTAAVCVVADNTAVGKGMTYPQLETLANFVRACRLLYPEIKVIGHRQLKATACPGFDVPTWLRDLETMEAPSIWLDSDTAAGSDG